VHVARILASITRIYVVAVILLWGAPTWAAVPAEPIPSDPELEQSGAVIGEVLIDNQNIFNLNDPREDTKLFRLANHLHPRTREYVIRAQLLFRPGDRYSRHTLEESARILRRERYFYDAWIEPVRFHDGKVDVRVTTRDVWTLNPGVSFGRSGGKNSSGFELEELNIFGSGAQVAVSHKTSVDRTTDMYSVGDPHAFGSWVSVFADYSNNSDGTLRQIAVDRPFYALDVRHAGGISAFDDLQTDSLYDRGQIVDKFQDQARFASGYIGFSSGLHDGWVRRWRFGATYDEHEFAAQPTWTGTTLIPEDRKFVYPWVQLDLIQDDFLKYRNYNQIERTEDFYLGNSFSLRMGWADSAYGSSRSALLFQGRASQGLWATDRTTVLASETYSGRVESGALRNAIFDGHIQYYVKQTENWLFFTTLDGTLARNLDLDTQLLLGGDNGLRGYPLRYQGGDARALFTVEQRYFTDWYPFRLFRVGAAVFFDAGRTWGSAPVASQSLGVLKDAGIGLRIGNSRSGLGNIIHVDIAFPFDGDNSIKRVQFIVQTKQSF
jgi:outer membrane protein assembly factor BamA